MINLNSKINKCLQALNVKGKPLLISNEQYYDFKEKRTFTKIKLYMPTLEYDEKKKTDVNKRVCVLESYNKIEVLMYLANELSGETNG